MAAEKPSENEERLRFVANAVPALLAYVDAGARYVWCNETYRRWFGYAPEELRGHHLSDVLGPDAWDRLRPYVERALNGEEVTFETRVVYKNGPARDVRASYIPHLDSGGKVRGFVVLSNDLSEIKATELALRRSEHMLERSQSTAHVGSYELMVADAPADGVPARTVRWSDETYRMFGLEPGSIAVTHATFFEFIHPDDRERVRAASPGKIQRAAPFENDFRVVRPDGTIRYMHTWTNFECDADGKPVRMVGTCQDVTERKHAELELREADRRKDEFLAMLSHELRNPLAPIVMALEIMRLKEPNDESIVWARDVIARQTAQLTRLVDDLLDVSRITLGKITLNRSALDLRSIVAQAVEAAQPLLSARQHHLTVDVPAAPLPIWGDGARLTQIISNLLNNAARFTADGGHIALAVRREGGRAVLSVKDDGIGIQADMRERVFDMFTQIEWPAQRKQEGLGIGLALVKRLVEMHDGDIEARSEGPGCGSELIVRLPMATGDLTIADAAAADARAAADGPRPERILVVDDNVDAAESLSRLLRLQAHEVRVAYDGLAALAAARDMNPDVVLLDIGLPKMDGLEVAKSLRARGDGPRPLLVAMTGFGQAEDRARTAAAGFDHHLTKPVDAKVLQSLMQTARAARA